MVTHHILFSVSLGSSKERASISIDSLSSNHDSTSSHLIKRERGNVWPSISTPKPPTKSPQISRALSSSVSVDLTSQSKDGSKRDSLPKETFSKIGLANENMTSKIVAEKIQKEESESRNVKSNNLISSENEQSKATLSSSAMNDNKSPQKQMTSDTTITSITSHEISSKELNCETSVLDETLPNFIEGKIEGCGITEETFKERNVSVSSIQTSSDVTVILNGNSDFPQTLMAKDTCIDDVNVTKMDDTQNEGKVSCKVNIEENCCQGFNKFSSDNNNKVKSTTKKTIQDDCEELLPNGNTSKFQSVA